MISPSFVKPIPCHPLGQTTTQNNSDLFSIRRQDISTGIRTKSVCEYGVCHKQPHLWSQQYADIIFHIVLLIINSYTKSDAPREPIIFITIQTAVVRLPTHIKAYVCRRIIFRGFPFVNVNAFASASEKTTRCKILTCWGLGINGSHFADGIFNAFPRMRSSVCCFNFHCCLFTGTQLVISRHNIKEWLDTITSSRYRGTMLTYHSLTDDKVLLHPKLTKMRH